MPEDQFLDIYEEVDNRRAIEEPAWVPAKELDFPTSHGISTPWKLSPRLIPYSQYGTATFKAVHNIESTAPRADWEKAVLGPRDEGCHSTILLLAGSRHYVELEVDTHITAFLIKFLSALFDIPCLLGNLQINLSPAMSLRMTVNCIFVPDFHLIRHVDGIETCGFI